MQSIVNQENSQYNYTGALYKSLETCDLVMVTFVTAAGTERVMGCTRNLDAVPEEKREGINNKKLNGDHLVCVYDFQNSGWRSFRKDSVAGFYVA